MNIALWLHRDYVVVDALPKNNCGKIPKAELRALDARRAPNQKI